MSELKSLTLNGTTYDSFTDQTSSRSRLLSSDSNINDLLENGRYYITGGANNATIREIVTNAGIEVPAEASGRSACALFVDVTRQERKSGGPGDPVGQPSQHVTLYFTGGKPENYIAFEYDRVHNLSGSFADGEHWGDWYTANNIVTDKFVAEYGVSTYADIYTAFTAGKSVYCKNGYYELPMTFYQNQSNTARFSGTAGGEKVVWQVKTNEWSSEALVDEDKFVAEYGVSTYSEIYSAMQEGKSIFCKNGHLEFPMVKFSAPGRIAWFGGMADGQSVTWKLGLGVWSESNVQIGTGGGAFVVNLDLVEQDNGEPMLVPDKTFTEIKTAIDEGQDVTAVVTQVGIVLHVLQYDESKVTFAYSFVEKTDLGTSYTTMQAIIQSDGRVVSDIVTENLVTEVSSGVYVGSGDMPEDCNVQIDPDGEALDLNALIDARIEVALGVIENGTY